MMSSTMGLQVCPKALTSDLHSSFHRKTLTSRHHSTAQPSVPRRLCLTAASGERFGQPKFQGGPSLQGLSNPGSTNTSPYLPFRKPPPSNAPVLSVDEMLEILRDRRGLWYEFAPHITALLNQGLTPSLIAEVTGIQGGEQSVMVVAAQVYNTLKESGCASLAYFDVGGAEILYELRILAVNRRKDAAEFVVEQRMDGKGARDLSKAIKEHERRKREDGQDSFSPAPGDCLAFAYFRMAKEATSRSEKVSALQKAEYYASTEPATKRIQDALSRLSTTQGKTVAADVSSIRVPIVRLRPDETFPSPLPILGSLATLKPSDFKQAVSNGGLTRKEGPFAMFSPSASSVWMSIPSWPAVAAATGIVAGLVVEDPNTIPSLKGKWVQGPMILIVEIGGQWGGGSGDLFVVEDGDRLTVGGATNSAILGRVIVALLPPKVGEDAEDLDED